MLGTHLLLEPILCLAFLGLPAGDPDPQAKEIAAPAPSFKTPQSTEKYKVGIQKLEAEDFSGAGTLLTASLKDASTPADRKVIQGLVDDTKLGLEIVAARKLLDQKSEKKALAKVETALKKNPESSIAPKAQKVINEIEELLFLIVDDFEPGDGLPDEADEENADEKRGPPRGSINRWRTGMTANADSRFILHGKGSMKWRAGGKSGGRAGPGGPGGPGGPPNESRGYRSSALKDVFNKSKWRVLAFQVYLPEAEDGSLLVTLAPSTDAELAECLYTQKLIDFHGKKGWLPVYLDLSRDFANTRNVKLEDMRFIKIDSPSAKRRTIYIDFVHLE